MTGDRDHPVVVVGGGITGLVAALRLQQAGREVVVHEAGDRVGGKLQASSFDGVEGVDGGADAMLARVPWGLRLLEELDLPTVSPATGTALVWWNDRLHPLPDGLMLGVPAGLMGLARSRLLTPIGKLRAASEPFRPRTPATDNLGALIRSRFGDQVAERLVDPLVGGINAGDIDHLSLSAATPQIAPAAANRSLLIGLQRNRPTPSPGPVFVAPRGGMGSLAHEVAGRLHDVRLNSPVTSLERDDAGWAVNGIRAGGVILATPAAAGATLLATLTPDIATALRAIRTASVVMVTLAYDRADVRHRLDASGFLVPKPRQQHMTACSFGSSKWAHWAGTDRVVLRVSLGRFGNEAPLDFDDTRAVQTAHDEIAVALSIAGSPQATRVTRWPQAFPQYEPGHQSRVADIRRASAFQLPGVVLAGASYDGIGVPACIRQAEEAVRSITARDGHH